MDAPDREETLKQLLNAGTASRVEQVLDDAWIRLGRSTSDPLQFQGFWHSLSDDLDRATQQGQSSLTFNRLVSYARASIKDRANR